MDGWVYMAACDADPAVRERPTDNNEGRGETPHPKSYRKKRRFFFLLFPNKKGKKEKKMTKRIQEGWPSYYIYRGLHMHRRGGQWNVYISEPDIWFLSHRVDFFDLLLNLDLLMCTAIPLFACIKADSIMRQHTRWRPINHISTFPKMIFFFRK